MYNAAKLRFQVFYCICIFVIKNNFIYADAENSEKETKDKELFGSQETDEKLQIKEKEMHEYTEKLQMMDKELQEVKEKHQKKEKELHDSIKILQLEKDACFKELTLIQSNATTCSEDFQKLKEEQILFTNPVMQFIWRLLQALVMSIGTITLLGLTTLCVYAFVDQKFRKKRRRR